jgi:hypothetical protein
MISVFEGSSGKNRRSREAEDAMEEDYPTTLVNENGEEMDHPNCLQMRELELLHEDWNKKTRGRDKTKKVCSVCRKPDQGLLGKELKVWRE